ncbi:MAG: uncharacterized protein KVP18_004750 [Porospora cf. gigantea A]|uniref:uncharacterized protein n=1 Tax=Porospora cf. gigantea A TaxID=2853593 RepID=UPI0035598979|nr:MAG: hypothetical protein KVP18_004750 [Porospora cf. gigantea A]
MDEPSFKNRTQQYTYGYESDGMNRNEPRYLQDAAMTNRRLFVPAEPWPHVYPASQQMGSVTMVPLDASSSSGRWPESRLKRNKLGCLGDWLDKETPSMECPKCQQAASEWSDSSSYMPQASSPTPMTFIPRPTSQRNGVMIPFGACKGTSRLRRVFESGCGSPRATTAGIGLHTPATPLSPITIAPPAYSNQRRAPAPRSSPSTSSLASSHRDSNSVNSNSGIVVQPDLKDQRSPDIFDLSRLEVDHLGHRSIVETTRPLFNSDEVLNVKAGDIARLNLAQKSQLVKQMKARLAVLRSIINSPRDSQEPDSDFSSEEEDVVEESPTQKKRTFGLWRRRTKNHEL